MSQQQTSVEVAINSVARAETLQRAVRRALCPSHTWLRVGIIAAALTAASSSATAAPFPPVFPLASLLPSGAGNGSQGFVLPGIDENDQVGISVSGAGDLNGDGIDDVIIGAPTAAAGGNLGAGVSYVVFGSTQGFPAVLGLESLYPGGGGNGSHGFVLSGINAGDGSGRSVSGAGDINGDGIDDLIIGAPAADPDGHNNAGESYVVFGSTQGFPAVLSLASLLPAGGGNGSAGFVLAGIDADYSGFVVNAAGDVNGDGIDDLIIGISGPTSRNAYVVFGSTQGFPAVLPLASLFPAGGGNGSTGFVLAGAASINGAIRAVSAAGDVNGDGIDDIIVGAPLAVSAGNVQAGASYVVFGSTQGFPAVLSLASLYPAGGGNGSAGFVLSGIRFNDRSGFSVSAAGDVNGDGIDDVIVGAYLGRRGQQQYAGESYVVFGSTQGFPAVLPLASLLPAGGGNGSAGFVLSGVDATDHSGASVSAAGDVNDDGIDDLIVGAPVADPNGHSNAGESYVVFGSTQGFPAVLPLASLFPAGGGNGSAGVVLTGIDEFDFSGNSAKAAGDVNGDGTDDLIIGAWGADRGHLSSTGESYVVFGRGAAQ